MEHADPVHTCHSAPPEREQTLGEEIANAVSHGVGAILLHQVSDMAVLAAARIELIGNLDRLCPVDIGESAHAGLVAVAGRVEVEADLGVHGTEVELELAALVEAEPVPYADSFRG